MKRFRWRLQLTLALGIVSGAAVHAADLIHLQSGFVYRIHCQGRLLVSAVGDERFLRLEALPKEMGCGALIKPLQSSGRTNLILETSAGTIVRLVELHSPDKGGVPPLEITLEGRSSP